MNTMNAVSWIFVSDWLGEVKAEWVSTGLMPDSASHSSNQIYTTSRYTAYQRFHP